MQVYANNAFFQFVSRLVGEKRTHEAFRPYNVGTAKLMGWSTVFWQVDAEGRIRTGKIMKYGEDGHRVKIDGSGKVNWVHSQIRVSGCRMVQCFFGEHLLSTRPDATIVLVEAEKTAVIASLFFSDFLWLATGGNSGCLNPTASQVLNGREVKLLPDLGMEEDWLKKAEMLRPICKSVEMLTWLSDQATDEQRTHGLDIADFIVKAALPPTPEPKTVLETAPFPDSDKPSFSESVAESVEPFYDPAEWPWPPPDPNEVCPF